MYSPINFTDIILLEIIRNLIGKSVLHIQLYGIHTAAMRSILHIARDVFATIGVDKYYIIRNIQAEYYVS